MIRKKIKVFGCGIIMAAMLVSCAAEQSLREYEKGVLAYQAGNFTEATTYFEAALQKNPDKAEYYLYYGYTLMELGRYDEAQAQFEKAMLDKEIAAVRDNTKRAYRGAGIAAYYRGDLQQAMIYLHLAYQMEELPELNADILAYTQQIELERVNSYLNMGSIAKAQELCDSFEKMYGSDNATLWLAKGSIAVTQKEYSEAAKYYEQALLFGSDTIETRIAIVANWSMAMQQETMAEADKTVAEGRVQEVVTTLRTMSPTNSKEQRDMGLLFYLVGEFEAAKSLLQPLYDEGEAELGVQLAQIAIANKQYPEAVPLLQEIADRRLKEDASCEEECFQAAFCAAKAGELAVAENYCTQGRWQAEDAGKSLQRWERLSLYISSQQGEYEEAYEELEAYVEAYLTPDSGDWEAYARELQYLEYRLD
ncbi:MAG: tetratricopeptide repeat protein [Lachnospiraceae bacterium]|nr:tetratricopeptide repeat protein [Lachnospiraceae bacterium]